MYIQSVYSTNILSSKRITLNAKIGGDDDGVIEHSYIHITPGWKCLCIHLRQTSNILQAIECYSTFIHIHIHILVSQYEKAKYTQS